MLLFRVCFILYFLKLSNISGCCAVHFEENLDKILEKLDTKFRINLQKYRQFSECSTEKIIEEVYNYITMKWYNNDTSDMF